VLKILPNIFLFPTAQKSFGKQVVPSPPYCLSPSPSLTARARLPVPPPRLLALCCLHLPGTIPSGAHFRPFSSLFFWTRSAHTPSRASPATRPSRTPPLSEGARHTSPTHPPPRSSHSPPRLRSTPSSSCTGSKRTPPTSPITKLATGRPALRHHPPVPPAQHHASHTNHLLLPTRALLPPPSPPHHTQPWKDPGSPAATQVTVWDGTVPSDQMFTLLV
jgi:hypothetical protein